MPKVECIDCAKLPYRYETGDMADWDRSKVALFRPDNPRKIDPSAPPDKPRCTTHQRVVDRAARTAEMALRERTCVDCWKLPVRPNPPRDLSPGPGPRRCATHRREARNTRRAKAAANHRLRTHRITDEEHGELLAEQGGTCPCGNRVKHIDHDHLIARTLCDHPEAESCERCRRGLLCHICNSDILGRGYNRRRLLALVAYLDDPPMARIRRRERERLEGA